jgi:hypothetical protein
MFANFNLDNRFSLNIGSYEIQLFKKITTNLKIVQLMSHLKLKLAFVSAVCAKISIFIS